MDLVITFPPPFSNHNVMVNFISLIPIFLQILLTKDIKGAYSRTAGNRPASLKELVPTLKCIPVINIDAQSYLYNIFFGNKFPHIKEDKLVVKLF